jgi:hypothetical protein
MVFTLEEINMAVFEILGEDHPVSQAILSNNETVPVIPVLVECLNVLSDRIKALEEERSIH